ncbi:MAG: ABC transporter substrate-binding protein, partial [Planctomycetota bacterium]|nr:ABC transporter substrate-binding protein [Planctomycetota bacterium]
GGIDGATTHLAEQVVAKARLPLLSAGSTDRTVNLANVPWMFSCLPGDQLQAPILVERVAATIGKRSFVEITTDDHDSRQFAVELSRALNQQQISPQYHYTCKASAEDVAEVIGRTVQAAPAAVLCVADAHDTAKLMLRLREAGYRGPVFGGPAMGRRRFLQEAGRAAEGVVFPLLVDRDADSQPFREAFLSKCGTEPDFAATCSYDAVKLLVAAIRQAGLNRARIGDAIRELAPWPGAAGTIQWDPLGSNRRPVRLGTIREGRIVQAS